MIADDTKRLVGGLFEYRDLGAVALKGFDVPARAWQVIGEERVKRRLGAFDSHLRPHFDFACERGPHASRRAGTGTGAASRPLGTSDRRPGSRRAADGRRRNRQVAAGAGVYFLHWPGVSLRARISLFARTTPTVRCIPSSICFRECLAGGAPTPTKPSSRNSRPSARAFDSPRRRACPFWPQCSRCPRRSAFPFRR